MIEAVKEQPGFEEGGRILANRDEEFFTAEDTDGPPEERAFDGNMSCMVYGMEELLLGRLEVLEGSVDMEKLQTGNYILEGILLDDSSNPKWNTSHYEIGDRVVLHNKNGVREFEVMAKVAVKYYTNSVGVGYGYNFYLPADSYQEMVKHPGVMSYSFNVTDQGGENMEEFLAAYTETVEPVMSYSSKVTRAGEFLGMRNLVLIVGGVLSLIIGFIGVLNFVNSMLTSILTRRREFAMLQSIGMTGAQLRAMLLAEGLLYALLAGGLSLLLGSVLSLTVLETVTENFWFFTFRFTLTPLLITIPLLLLIGATLPVLVLRSVTKQSVVERLRESE